MPAAIITPSRRLIVPQRGFRKPAHPVLDPTHQLSRGLVACWLLGDGAGYAQELVGSGHDGIPQTAPTRGPAKFGGLAYTFNGSTQWIKGGTVGSLANAPALTVSAWIKTAASAVGRIVSFTNGSTTGWVFRTSTTNSLAFTKNYSTQTLIRAAANSTVSQAVWHHVVATWPNSQTATNTKLYIDGAETTYAAGPTDGTGTNGSDAANNVGIGAQIAGANFFNGSMENLRVYFRVLPLSEIAWLNAEPYAGVVESAPRWRIKSTAAFKPAWAYGATRTIGGAFQ